MASPLTSRVLIDMFTKKARGIIDKCRRVNAEHPSKKLADMIAKQLESQLSVIEGAFRKDEYFLDVPDETVTTSGLELFNQMEYFDKSIEALFSSKCSKKKENKSKRTAPYIKRIVMTKKPYPKK